MAARPYAVRENAGQRELVWIETVRNGFWRGVRLADGGRTRGPVAALIGRCVTEREARALLATEAA